MVTSNELTLVDAIHDHLNTLHALVLSDPEHFSEYEGRLLVKLTGECNHSYLLNFARAQSFIGEISSDSVEYDSSMQLDAQLFLDLLVGKVNPQVEFAKGNIVADGAFAPFVFFEVLCEKARGY